MSLPRLRIKKREQQRLRQGHLWVYSNEIDTAATPLKPISTSLVHLEDYRGEFIGTASFCAHALICARLLDTRALTALDSTFFIEKIEQALQLRQLCFALPYYRLVYAEGDFLPGLVIDRYNDVFVVQIATHALENAIAELTLALQTVFGKNCQILFKHDGKGRDMENLPKYVSQVGEPISHLDIIENNVHFTAATDGQKTGWFYDHRQGRQWLNQRAKGKTVLDLFSYVGGWGVQAAAHGATAVTCIDVSAAAGERLLANAALNQCADVSFIAADIFAWLKTANKETYDVVVLDPPALIQKRKDLDQGRQAYFTLNEAAISRVTHNGLFISASCSMHLNRSELLSIVQQVAKRTQKHVQLIQETHPDADHPRLTAMSETDYLKCLMFRVTDIATPAVKPV